MNLFSSYNNYLCERTQVAYHLQAWRENRIFSFFCLTTRCLPQNSFSGSKNGLIPLDTILDQDENVQLVSCIFSSAWPQSKTHLKRQKANLGHARNGWNRRICLLFLVFCLEDKISLRLPHCTRLYTFESRSGGPFLSARKSLKTAFDQIQTNMSKPPKKVDIDILASGKTNYHSKIKEMLCIPN